MTQTVRGVIIARFIGKSDINIARNGGDIYIFGCRFYSHCTRRCGNGKFAIRFVDCNLSVGAIKVAISVRFTNADRTFIRDIHVCAGVNFTKRYAGVDGVDVNVVNCGDIDFSAIARIDKAVNFGGTEIARRRVVHNEVPECVFV